MTDSPTESAQDLRQRADEKFKVNDAENTKTPSSGERQQLLHELGVHQIELEMQVDELRIKQQELDTARARYFNLYNLAPVGYLTLSENGLIQDANLTAAAMLGVSRTDLLRNVLSKFIFHEDQDIYYLHRKRTNDTGGVQAWDMRLLQSNGSVFWAHLQSVPAQNGECWITLSDITERKHMENELLQAKITAESANIAKSQFLANMSHEIRTPMNGVIGMAQLLELTELTGEQQGYLDTLMLSGRNLIQLICDILDLSNIEAHRLELESREFDLREETAGTVNILKLFAQEKGLELEWLIDPDVPLLLKGDAGRLRQILTNLIGNAIKFTAKGSTSLHIRKDAENEHSLTLRFLVRDSGIGIEADQLDRIFERFSQADGSTTRNYGGSGLGLTLSRHLAELMGGCIGVDSVEGEGSTFWFTAVLEKPVKKALDVSPPFMLQRKPERGETKGLHILLVEDDPPNQFAASRLLTLYGYRVDVASNGREALDLLEENDYALVLMDCMMPVMDGYEATAAIRDQASNVKNHAIPVIALTANTMREDREKCLAAGMDDYLAKPVEIAVMLAMLEKWTIRE